MKIINSVFLLGLFFLNQHEIKSQSQLLVYSDTWRGGITGSGINLAFASNDGDTIQLNIDENSSIRRAFLFYATRYKPEPDNLIINSNEIFLNIGDDVVGNSFSAPSSSNELFIGMKDITNIIDISFQETIIIPPFSIPVNPNPMYADFYILIEYENNLMPLITSNVYINQLSSSQNMDYALSNLNAINTSVPTSLIFNASALYYSGVIEDGYNIEINNTYCGFIGGTDPLSLVEGGVIGSFYYQNNELFGLSDDIPDTLFYGTDAIADISQYLSSTTDINVQLSYQTPEDTYNALSNVIWQLFLNYTTTCEEFEATVPEDVVLCQGDSTILQVIGGNTYEWQPQEGLSCYDCPNPTYNDTITRWYTVKINNNDSCSKTLPMHVKVLPVPLTPILSSSPTLCSDSNGVITVQQMDDTYQYSLESGAFQNEGTFNNLATGNYTVITKNEHGCTSQPSTITIEEINPTQAQFTATPTQGEIPLTVQFNNQSTDATDYTWYIGNDTIYEASPSYIFTETGEFTASLIAYDTYPWCSDTSEVLTIITEYPFNIIIPSTYFSYTDSYQIYTSRVSQLDYTLFNSIGQQVYHRHFIPETGYSPLWERKDVARGVYLYTVKVTGEDGEVREIVGRVVVV